MTDRIKPGSASVQHSYPLGIPGWLSLLILFIIGAGIFAASYLLAGGIR